MNRSQSPVVGELEYRLLPCSVKALGVTTIASLKPWAPARRSPLSSSRYLLGERVLAAAVPVQEIHHGKPSCLVPSVTRRQIDAHVAIGRVAFEVPLERRTVDGDALDLAGTRAGRTAAPCPRRRRTAAALRLHRHQRRHRQRHHPGYRAIPPHVASSATAILTGRRGTGYGPGARSHLQENHEENRL